MAWGRKAELGMGSRRSEKDHGRAESRCSSHELTCKWLQIDGTN